MQLTPTYSTYRNEVVAKQRINKHYTDYFKVKIIIDVLCMYSGYKRDILLMKGRHRDLVALRNIGMAIAKNNTSLSLKKIADKFKRANHTATLHAVNTVSDLCDTDKFFKDKVSAIQNMIEKHFYLANKF